MHAEDNIPEELYAQAIGWEVLKYIKDYNVHLLARQMESDAIALIPEIKAILDDRTLDDPTCFQQVDAIVLAFYAHNLNTDRHWELD